MKKLYFMSLLLMVHGSIVPLNQFDISTLPIAQRATTAQKNKIKLQRIDQELGHDFTMQDILALVDKIQAYCDNLLNTQDFTESAWLIAENAFFDVEKAKMVPTIRSNTVTPAIEHELRVKLGKLKRMIRKQMTHIKIAKVMKKREQES